MSDWTHIATATHNGFIMSSYEDENNCVIKLDLLIPYQTYSNFSSFFSSVQKPTNCSTLVSFESNNKYSIENYDGMLIMTGKMAATGYPFILRVVDSNGDSVSQSELISYYQAMSL